MAKKGKTTLKDLDQFLKQQPSKLVDVDKAGAPEAAPATESEDLDAITLANQLIGYAQQEGKPLSKVIYDVVTLALESQGELSHSEIMLLNTISYLDHSDSIAAAIKKK